MTEAASPSVISLVRFRIRDGMTDAIRSVLAEAQSAISREQGCLFYRFSVDLAAPDVVCVTEHWRDQAALDAHTGNAHSAELVANLIAAGMTDFEVQNHTICPQRNPPV